MSDKRMTEEDVVAELRDGMTIGIGGWGSRRKPMSIVRAIAQLGPEGSHGRELRRPRPRPAVRDGQGAEGDLPVLLARLDRARAALPQRAAVGIGADARARRGHVPARAAGGRVAGAVPPDARRTRFVRGRPSARDQDGGLALRRRRGARRGAGAEPRRRDHPHAPGRRTRQRAVPQRRPVLRQPRGSGRADVLHERRAAGAHRGPGEQRSRADAADQPADDPRRGRGAEGRALHRVRPRLRPRRGVPEGVRRERQGSRRVGGVEGASTSTAATTPSTGRWPDCE